MIRCSRFAGREWDDEAQLSYNRARYYDPVAGRFLSEDPLGPAAPDGNLYRYAGNDPVNFVDPTGLTQAGNPLNNLFNPTFINTGNSLISSNPIGPIGNFDVVGPSIGFDATQLLPGIGSDISSSAFSSSLAARLSPAFIPVPLSVASASSRNPDLSFDAAGELARFRTRESLLLASTLAAEEFERTRQMRSIQFGADVVASLPIPFVESVAEGISGFASSALGDRTGTAISAGSLLLGAVTDTGVDAARTLRNAANFSTASRAAGDFLNLADTALLAGRTTSFDDAFTQGRIFYPSRDIIDQQVFGTLAEFDARRMAAGELQQRVFLTQFRQGAVARGFDFGSIEGIQLDAQLIFNEVKLVTGSVRAEKFTAFGLGARGEPAFADSLRSAVSAIHRAGLDDVTTDVLLEQARSGRAVIQLFGSRNRRTVFAPNVIRELEGSTGLKVRGTYFLDR